MSVPKQLDDVAFGAAELIGFDVHMSMSWADKNGNYRETDLVLPLCEMRWLGLQFAAISSQLHKQLAYFDSAVEEVGR